MALKLKDVAKTSQGLYIVTIEDTGNQIGTDELGNPIYRTYTAKHNPNEALSVFKQRFLNQIKAVKNETTELSNMKTTIESAISNIDATKL